MHVDLMILILLFHVRHISQQNFPTRLFEINTVVSMKSSDSSLAPKEVLFVYKRKATTEPTDISLRRKTKLSILLQNS